MEKLSRPFFRVQITCLLVFTLCFVWVLVRQGVRMAGEPHKFMSEANQWNLLFKGFIANLSSITLIASTVMIVLMVYVALERE